MLLTIHGDYGHIAAMLKTWRLTQEKSQAECALALGLPGGARSFQRLESGESNTDADMVERIARLTGGAVTAADMHAVRLAWLKANRPEKFGAEAPAALPSPPVGEGGRARSDRTDEGCLGADLSDVGAGNPSSAPSGHLLPQGEKGEIAEAAE